MGDYNVPLDTAVIIWKICFYIQEMCMLLTQSVCLFHATLTVSTDFVRKRELTDLFFF